MESLLLFLHIHGVVLYGAGVVCVASGCLLGYYVNVRDHGEEIFDLQLSIVTFVALALSWLTVIFMLWYIRRDMIKAQKRRMEETR